MTDGTDLIARLGRHANSIEAGKYAKLFEEAAARIAELEAALKRLHDATSGIDKIYTLTDDEEAYWSRELRAARAAYLGEKE